jgi:hypothetical protein
MLRLVKVRRQEAGGEGDGIAKEDAEDVAFRFD